MMLAITPSEGAEGVTSSGFSGRERDFESLLLVLVAEHELLGVEVQAHALWLLHGQVVGPLGRAYIRHRSGDDSPA